MKITEEMVRALQAKVDISYEEAEKLLKKANGDVDVAYLLYRERGDSFSDRVNSGLGGFMQYRFRISRKGDVLLDLPIAVILLIMLLDGIWNRAYVVIFLFIIALVAECEFKIDKHREDKTNKDYKHAHSQGAKGSQGPINKTSKDQSKDIIDNEIAISIEKEEAGVRDIQTQDELVQENGITSAFVELNKQEGYNENDVKHNDDQDDYYEIVIEE